MITPITTVEEFEVLKQRGDALLVITDSTGIKLHVADCEHVKVGYFREKVMKPRPHNGAYFEASTLAAALDQFGARLRICAPCRGRHPEVDVVHDTATTAVPRESKAEPPARRIHDSTAASDGVVRIGSEYTLPFEPKGDALRLRDEIRRAVATLVAGETQLLWACLHTNLPPSPNPVDAENVLFYNVGAAHFRGVQRAGLAWEYAPAGSAARGFAQPVLVEYSVRDVAAGFEHWDVGEVAVEVKKVRIPELRAESKPAALWKALHDGPGMERRSSESVRGDFGVDLVLCVFRPS